MLNIYKMQTTLRQAQGNKDCHGELAESWSLRFICHLSFEICYLFNI